MAENFLDKVYGVGGAEETRDLYDAWAATYDAEIAENGYATPARCAAALAGELHRHDAPILDFGCGTGLSGQALAAVGFQVIDGMDLSAGMLETARARGVYRNLAQTEPHAPLPVKKGAYAAIAAVGVISTGAAPAKTLPMLMGLLDPGGYAVFSFNDHALEDPAFEAEVQSLTKSGQARIVFRNYGDHLPARGIGSLVYLLRKA